MTELEKIQYTKSFIEKLANGVNPLNDEPIPDDDLLNNVRISRCMFYVSKLLAGICEDLTRPTSKKVKNADKTCFCISDENKQLFEYDENGMYIGNIAKQLNGLIDTSLMQKIKVKTIFDWLVDNNFLERLTSENGKEYKRTTDEGKAIGLYEETKVNAGGFSYILIVCNKNAQQFIVNHSNIIAESDVPQETPEFQGKPWDQEQDDKLITMFNDGLIVSEIAKELKRTTGAIKARLVRLGIIDNKNDAV